MGDVRLLTFKIQGIRYERDVEASDTLERSSK